jgi:hypothetical protein
MFYDPLSVSNEEENAQQIVCIKAYFNLKFRPYHRIGPDTKPI